MNLSIPAAVTVVLSGAVVLGGCLSVLNLVWAHTLQEMVPREQLGRVSAIDQIGSFALIPVGTGVAGWATGLIGPSPLFLIGGVISALLAAAGLLIPAIRNLD